MGWGEPIRPSKDVLLRQLVTAVQRFLAAPTTGNQEQMADVLSKVERASNTRSGW